MATIFDLIEVTNISSDTTYSAAQGNYLGVVDGMVSSALDDGEFDLRDRVAIDGVDYAITRIQEPFSSGRLTLTDGTNLSFDPQSESNLAVVFLTVSDGVDNRYFIVPNDSYGDMKIREIRTGTLNDVAGSDSAIVSTTDNAVSVVCFANGTLIECGDGSLKAVEDLQVGDVVNTLDHGRQTLTWTGYRALSSAQIIGQPELRPIRICKDALGPGMPDRDLYLSQNHRVFVRSRIAKRMFDVDEILVPAKKLVGIDGIAVSRSVSPISYHHLMFDRHEVIFANSAPCESLYPGRQAMKILRSIAKLEDTPVEATADVSPWFPPARLIADGQKARTLAKRHIRNNQNLIRSSDPFQPSRPPRASKD